MSVMLKPYPAYKDSGLQWVGKIPAHWSVKRIKYVFREMDRRNSDGNGTLLSLTRTRGLICQSDASNRLPSADDLTKYKVCMPGELVMNRMQAWSGMFATAGLEGLVSPDYSIFKACDGAEVLYFEHLFKTPYYVDQFAQSSKGIGSGFNRLYTPDFGAIRVVVPPQHEQRLIVQALQVLIQHTARFIRAKRQMIELLNEQRQVIIHQAVTRGLNPNVRLKPSGIDWLGGVPEHWEIWEIGHLAKVGNGSTPSRSNGAYWAESGYPWLNSSCVNQGHIRSADQYVTDLALQECHLPRVAPGSVLVAITGQGRTRGTAAVLGIEATINQHIAYITLQKDVVSFEYLRMFLVGMYVRLRAISDDSGSTRGALTCQDLKRFQIVVPPREEQSRIIAAVQESLSEIETALARIDREIALIREYRSCLIADVVTGKLDVRSVELPALDETAVLDDFEDDEVAYLAEETGEVEADEEENGN